MDMPLRTARILRRLIRMAALCLASVVVTAPVSSAAPLPLDRAELTGKLVPVTGETTRSVDLTVPFARGSADLTKTAREQLEELGAALAGEELRVFEVGVYGHTDASGPSAYNRKLSEMRATAVVRYLVEGFVLDRARFRHGGYGEERLLEGIDANSPRHRRVEIVVFSPGYGSTANSGTKTREDIDDKTMEGKGGSDLQAIE